MAKQSFGDFITNRRRELDLTLGDVATGLGVSPITVSNWSNGQATPDPAQLTALAELLEVPTDDLAKMSGVTPAERAVNLMPPVTAAAAAEKPEPADEDSTGPVAIVRAADEVAESPTAGSANTQEPVPIPKPAAPPDPMDDELAELIEEAKETTSGQREAAPARPAAAVATADRPARRRPALRRRREPGEQAVTAIPLTYVEDPKQLTRYRIRWALTTVALIVMFIILLWASGELVSALSEVKQAVTPGGLGS